HCRSRLSAMGEWYWIGLLVGVGAGFGVLFTGALSTIRGGVVAAILLAAAAGTGLGFALENWDEALGGGLGGLAGALGSAQVVRGALEQEAPALRFLAEHGEYGHATSTFPSLTPVCLSSIVTGAHPDVHHIPHLVWYHRGERRIVEYGSSFAALRAAGTRRAILDAI